MGSDKAWLEWAGSTLLGHTCDVLAAAVSGPVVVVRSAGQHLPAMPPEVRAVEDPRPRLGPLQGLAAGLAEAARQEADVAFVAATDLPLLAPAVVRRIVATLVEPDGPAGPPWEIALPVVSGEWQPLAAAYRTALARSAQSDVVDGRLSVRRFAGSRRVRLLTESDLLADDRVAADDPDLRSFVNVNEERELARVRAASRG